MSDKGFLVLENGMTFEGKFFGALPKSPVSGEVVFTTEMIGYIEALTDPNYHGQIVLHTFPLIGNYGVISEDFLSEASPAAYIVKEPCQDPSNFRSEGPLDTFLKKRGITGLYDVDTRAIAKIVRDGGTVYGTICANENAPAAAPVKNPVADISVKEIKRIKSVNPNGKTVGVLDFGVNAKHKVELLNRGYNLTVFPHDTEVDTIVAEKCAGLMLSGGPGNPNDYGKIVQNIKSLLGHKIPMFGVGLGHQLLALANGFRVDKLKCGHRGANQPVKDTESGKVHITRQNHGYAVVSNSVNKKIAGELFVNVNDKTCEGIEYKTHPAFSVQFDPSDKAFVFDKFESIIKGGNQ